MRNWLILLATGWLLSPCPAFSWDVVEFSPPPTKNSESIRIIDARDRDAWIKSHVPGAVTLAWDQFSQPGAPSRGTPRNNPQIIANDLAALGISPEYPVYIYGDGVGGRGNEGRLAWMLYGLGFKKIYVSDFPKAVVWWKKPLVSGPQEARPREMWRVNVRRNLELPLAAFRREPKKENYLLVAIRPSRHTRALPGIFEKTEIRFTLEDFELKVPEVKKIIDEQIALKGNKQNVTLLPLSYAGLSSAYAALKLKSWGYRVKLIPEGYSPEIK